MVCVYDLRSLLFGRPAFVRTRGEALRGFQDEVNRVGSPDAPNQLNAHPGDFQLFYVATFDDISGSFVCPNIPEKIADASSMVIGG